MITFLKYKLIYITISGVVIISGLVAILAGGLRFSIDFTGGSLLQYKFGRTVRSAEIQNIFSKTNTKILTIDQSEKNTFIIRTVPVSEAKETEIRKKIENNLKTSVTSLRVETVGPTLGRETVNKTLIASFVAILGILLYLTVVFKRLNFGFSAVLAMIHDLAVLVGTYAILGLFFNAEVDTLFVTALLTTLSFSVHDTIVVFDKIREYRRLTSLPLEVMANKAITETMVRSVNNSLTIVLMLVPLVLFGGETIRFFAASLLIGTITGTYSSPFVATPILVFLEEHRHR